MGNVRAGGFRVFLQQFWKLTNWWNPAGRHVGAADGLDLLHVAELLVVEQLVEVHDDLVEQADALHLVSLLSSSLNNDDDNSDNDHDDNDDEDNNNDDDNGDDAPHPLVDVLRVKQSITEYNRLYCWRSVPLPCGQYMAIF